MTRPLVYIAAPLFSDAEKSINDAMCAVVEQYCNVFLPQRDGSLLPDLIRRGMNVDAAYAHVFQCDVDAIRRADVLIINLDGRTVDEGAAFELGLAFASNKTCVGYRSDVRTLLEWGLNPMIISPLSCIVRDLAELDGWCSSYISATKSLRSAARSS